MTKLSQGFFARGGGWVVIQFALIIAVIVLGLRFPGAGSYLAAKIIGTVLLAAGVGLGIAGSILLGRHLSPFPGPQSGSTLRQSGIYGWVRHPLYTGVMLSSLGWAVFRQSAWGLGAALILVGFFSLKARREERCLREQFREYADYARRVPRFLPRLVRGSEAGGTEIKNDS